MDDRDKATWINACSQELLRLCKKARKKTHGEVTLALARMLHAEVDHQTTGPTLAAYREFRAHINPVKPQPLLPAPKKQDDVA